MFCQRMLAGTAHLQGASASCLPLPRLSLSPFVRPSALGTDSRSGCYGEYGPLPCSLSAATNSLREWSPGDCASFGTLASTPASSVVRTGVEAVDSPSCSHSQSQTASDGEAACPLSHCADALPTDVLAPWPSTNRVRAWTDVRTCHRQEVTCSVQTLFCHKEHLASTDLLHNFVQARSTRPEPRGVSSEDGRGRRCAATPRRVCARRRRARPERGVDPGALQVQRVHRGIRQQRVDRLPRLHHATAGPGRR